METRPPTVTRILVAVGFALSCFAPGAVPVDRLRRPAPLKPEGYRFTVPFNEATQLAVESDVRISGVSVGKVKSIELSATTGSPTRRSSSTARTRRSPTTRGRSCARRRCSARPTSSSPRASKSAPSLPEGGSLPPAQVAELGPARRDLPHLRQADASELQGLDAGRGGGAQGPRRGPLGRRSPSSTRSPSRRTARCASSTASSTRSASWSAAAATSSRRSPSARASSAA